MGATGISVGTVLIALSFSVDGAALGVLAVAPMVMAAVVLLLFPETARRELEGPQPRGPARGRRSRNGQLRLASRP